MLAGTLGRSLQGFLDRCHSSCLVVETTADMLRAISNTLQYHCYSVRILFSKIRKNFKIYVERGVVALSVECRTCDQEVVGSSLGRACGVKTLGKFLTPLCLCSPSGTSWYRPKGGDALRLGSKDRHGSCVGGR